MNKADLVKIFQDTLKICQAGKYYINKEKINISDDVKYAINNTVLYDANFMDGLDNLASLISDEKCKIEVTKESTVAAGLRIRGGLALNFASGVSVGGGVLYGAIAQEEDLCRSSCLYNCIEQEEKYYERNLASIQNISNSGVNGIYTDNMIYSPDVVFFRDGNLNLLKNPFKMSIITVPAPCIRGMDTSGDVGKSVKQAFEIRIIKMLVLAAYLGHKELILGAWGCGAFGNSAIDVANMFKRILMMKELRGLFDRIIFAVYAKDEYDVNYEAFNKILGKLNEI